MNLLSAIFVGQNEVDAMALKPISNDPQLNYIDSLSFSTRKRYLGKLKIGGQVLNDPYSMDEDCWCDDMTKWPELLFGDIYTYSINTKGLFMKENLKAYKSLEAYNYFYNGYVRTVLLHHSGNLNVMKAKVNPSQKSPENSHEPWVIISSQDGSVVTAHCTCMAK